MTDTLEVRRAAHLANVKTAVEAHKLTYNLRHPSPAPLIGETPDPGVADDYLEAVENLLTALKQVVNDAQNRRADRVVYWYADDTHASLWDALNRSRQVFAGAHDLGRYDPLILPLEAVRRVLDAARLALEEEPEL